MTTLLEKLDWSALEDRRNYDKVTTFYKMLHNIVSIDVLQHLHPSSTFTHGRNQRFTPSPPELTATIMLNDCSFRVYQSLKVEKPLVGLSLVRLPSRLLPLYLPSSIDNHFSHSYVARNEL